MHNEGFLCAAWAPSMRFGKASGLMALASKGRIAKVGLTACTGTCVAQGYTSGCIYRRQRGAAALQHR